MRRAESSAGGLRSGGGGEKRRSCSVAEEGKGGATEETAHFSDVVHGDLNQPVSAASKRIRDAVKSRVDQQGFRIEVKEVAVQKRGLLQRNVQGVAEPGKQPVQLLRIEESVLADNGFTLSEGHEGAVQVKGAPQGVAVVFVQF